MTRPWHCPCPTESFDFRIIRLATTSLLSLCLSLVVLPNQSSAFQVDTTTADASASESAQAGTDAQAATDTSVLQTETSGAAPIKETTAKPQRDLPPWIKSIDSKFGFFVSILDKIIFFKLYTSADGSVKIPFVVVWLFGGALYLTFRMGFINFRAFWHAVRLTRGDYDNEGEPGDVSHFQALAAALSATVGLGNIAGVAIAIGMGGPGAAFWILIVGLLGMTSKFAECTLAQLYRSRDESGKVLGGPMRYLRVGLSDIGFPRLGRVLAIVFMVLCIGASFGGGNAFQIGQSLDTIRNEFTVLDQYPWVYGLIMVTAVGLVIVGGIKSIGNVASKIVPFMCGAYMLACLYILAMNFAAIPDAIVMIVSEAFNPTAIKGGFLGVLVIGIQRAVFSNEAGIGSAAIVHSAAKTNEPVSEGIVALLEPFVDTVIVCTCTALVVVVTGAYAAPEMAPAVARNAGAQVTLHAFVNGGHPLFAYVLYVAVVLFAFSTCISWSYYGERCWAELFGSSSSIIYKILFLTFTFLGSIVTRGNVLDFSDLMLLGMALPNLLGVFMMSGIIKRQLDNYWNRYRAGKIELGRDTSAM